MHSKIDAKTKPLIDGSRSEVDFSKMFSLRFTFQLICHLSFPLACLRFDSRAREVEIENQFCFTDVIRTAKLCIRFFAGVRNWSPAAWNKITLRFWLTLVSSITLRHFKTLIKHSIPFSLLFEKKKRFLTFCNVSIDTRDDELRWWWLMKLISNCNLCPVWTIACWTSAKNQDWKSDSRDLMDDLLITLQTSYCSCFRLACSGSVER